MHEITVATSRSVNPAVRRTIAMTGQEHPGRQVFIVSPIDATWSSYSRTENSSTSATKQRDIVAPTTRDLGEQGELIAGLMTINKVVEERLASCHCAHPLASAQRRRVHATWALQDRPMTCSLRPLRRHSMTSTRPPPTLTGLAHRCPA